MALAKFLKGIFKIRGDTDSTLIGNTGDRLRVIAIEEDDDFRTLLWADRRFSNGSTENMDLDGSSTPQDFTFGPPSGEVWFVDSIQVLILDPGTPDVDDFGSIGSGLSNGVQLIQEINSTEYELGNFKDNGALSLCFADSASVGTPEGEEGNGWFDENDYFMGVKRLRKPIRLDGDNNDKLIFRIRDNLNAVQRFQAVGRAWYYL